MQLSTRFDGSFDDITINMLSSTSSGVSFFTKLFFYVTQTNDLNRVPEALFVWQHRVLLVQIKKTIFYSQTVYCVYAY